MLTAWRPRDTGCERLDGHERCPALLGSGLMRRVAVEVEALSVLWPSEMGELGWRGDVSYPHVQ